MGDFRCCNDHWKRLKELCSFFQSKDQSVSVLRRLLQDIGAELQEDKSDFKAAQDNTAEVRKAGVCPPLCVRPRYSGESCR